MNLLAKNLNALRPRPAAEVARAAGRTAGAFCVTASRSGHPVTGVVVDAVERYFHSTYDPVKEGERLAESVTGTTVIVFGLGCGYHIRPLLRRGRRVVVVEPDSTVVRHTLSQVDLTDILSDPRTHLFLGAMVETLGHAIGSIYQPAIHGSASLLELPGRRQSEPALFAALRTRTGAAIEQVKNDFAVQSRFGRLWLRNTVANLRFAADETSRENPIEHWFRDRPVTVVAAGPSLEGHLGELARGGRGTLLSTDSALPMLVGAGITPSAAITVDPQQLSYLHYLSADVADVLILADLAAAPTVFTLYPRAVPLVSNHPLHQLLQLFGVRLPSFDSSGGNVAYAAVSLAARLGASSITVVGGDFSYPDGRTYARGSSIHRYLSIRSSRIRPLETHHFRFLWDRPGVYRDQARPNLIRQPALDRYRDHLSQLAASLAIPVTTAGGEGNPLQDLKAGNQPERGEAAVHPGPPAEGTSSGASSTDNSPPDAALPLVVPDGLLGQLRAFLAENVPSVDAFDQPDGDQARNRAALLALLPHAAWLRRWASDLPAEALLLAARNEALDVIDSFL